MLGPTRALPDFLTPRPAVFAPDVDDELATVRATPPDVVRRDLVATHAPDDVPAALAAADTATLADLLRRYWEIAIAPMWQQIRLLLEADVTYRARQLATGGARLLFADLHANVRWHDGTLRISEMIGRHSVSVSGRGLLLQPSLFAYKPVPPMSPTTRRAWPTRAAEWRPSGRRPRDPTPPRSPR